MEFKDLIERAKQIRQMYAELERKKSGKEWTREQIVEGFVGDVGDLVKLVMAKEGIRSAENLGEQIAGKGQVHENIDQKLAHELSDCLWSVIVIADKYNVDLEKSFMQTMDELEARISRGQE